MITIHIPKGENGFNLTNELMSAKNIKDKKVRDCTVTGLNKRERKGNEFTKRDLESGNLMAGYRKNRVNNILEE